MRTYSVHIQETRDTQTDANEPKEEEENLITPAQVRQHSVNIQ
jgi:hypothetical protein